MKNSSSCWAAYPRQSRICWLPAARRPENSGRSLRGIKVGGEAAGALFESNPGLMHIECSSDARASYAIGVAAGTAWLFTRPEWKDVLDFLFIDEAGQVPLANAVAMARCAKNLILLGDQMQLEQPVQGSHPGDAGLSVLQYALKDAAASKPDSPIFHAVIPPDVVSFLASPVACTPMSADSSLPREPALHFVRQATAKTFSSEASRPEPGRYEKRARSWLPDSIRVLSRTARRLPPTGHPGLFDTTALPARRH